MVYFFKRKSTRESPPKTVTKSPRVGRLPEIPVTPPITPEPGSPPDSSLQVKILAEPKEINTEKFPVDYDSDSDVSISDTRSSGVQSHMEKSLFKTVIDGMSCVPVSAWNTRAGGALSTIPENSIIPPTPIWGVAPSFDSDSNSESFDSLRNVHYDNFEMVLDEYNLENNDSRGKVGDLIKQENDKQQEKPENFLYCQPCNSTVEIGHETKMKSSSDKDKKVRREINLSGDREISEAAVRNTQKEEIKVSKPAESRAIEASKTSCSSVKLDETRSPKVDSSSESITVKPTQSKDRAKKALFHRKPQKIKNKGGQVKSSRFEKIMSKRSNKIKDMEKKGRNDGSQLSSITPIQPNKDDNVKKGRWKCATDAKSGNVYFYHSGSKDVSWEKPESFVEWRVTADLTTGKTCFVNRITKEATWTKPEEVQEWKEVHDATTGNNYYYNIFTRSTTWIKPNESIKSKEDVNNVNNASTNSGHEEQSVDDEGGQENDEENQPSRVEKYVIQEVNLEPEVIEKNNEVKDSEIPLQSVLTDHEMNETPSSSPLYGKLASLLSKYCPNEKEMNLQLLQKSVGQEALVIKAIEALVEDTPFDELQLSIFLYAKSVIRSMGEEPYDENLGDRERRGPPVTLNSYARPSFNRVQTMNSSTFSLNSRAVSQMTGKSGFTSKTNGTAETFRMTNTTKVTKTNVDRSFEEDSTDEEDISKLIFDMSVLQEDNLNGKERVQKVDNEKRKAKNAAVAATSVTPNILKPSAPKARLLEVKEIDLCGNGESEENSAYAADNDDETDVGSLNDGEDTISALSDSFGPSHSKRYRKEKRLLNEKAQDMIMLTKDRHPKVIQDLTRRTKCDINEKENDRNPTSHHTAMETKAKSQYTQHKSTQSSPYTFTYDNNAESPSIRQGRSWQERANTIEKHSLLPRYADVDTDEDSSSWDDDTVTTNPSMCMSADEKGGMYRYCRRNTRII